jgi:hypothetical protein
MEDSLSEWTTRLFRQLWAIASHDARIAAAMDRFYTRSIHAYLRRIGVRGPTPQNGLDLEALVYLIHMLSEGTIVLFGTRARSGDLFERVRAVADRALVQLIQSESSD